MLFGSGLASSAVGYGVFSVIAIILAIAATVLAFIFIVPDKKREKLNKFGKFLHDTVNFKYLIVEKILQALYIFATAFVILLGFFMLFMVVDTGWSTTWMGGYGILTMLFGPIIIRLLYEFLMMAILLVKNVIKINNKLKNQNESSSDEDIFAAPSFPVPEKAPAAPVTPVAPAAPVAPPAPKFCVKCGAALNAEGKCPNCD